MKTSAHLLLCGAALAVGMPSAPAQTTTLEEVTVTARKREETFADVPAAVNAFTEAEIKSAGIERPEDFIALTPGVTLIEVQNQGNAFINIRGIGQNRNSEPSAAILVDGVLLTNPAQFNQELFDIQQIEVVKGPQGALFGRNAIGGAIIIKTKQPTDEYEGSILVGGDNGPGYKVRGSVSGPMPGYSDLKFRASVSHYDTDGFIDNPFLGEEADPYKDTSGRLRLIWTPTDRFTADARFSMSKLDTQAFWYNITGNANDTSLPVRVNNAGENGRDLMNVSLKLDYEFDFGTLTTITSYDEIEEIATGDAFDFLPVTESFFYTSPFSFLPLGFADLNQSQYFDVETISQEIRFTSSEDRRLRWSVGGYMVFTDRFVSTGNMLDFGRGVFPVERTPRPTLAEDPTNPNPQATFLADQQDNFAWAVFGDVSYDVTDRLEASFSLRYDEDTREQTTLTPPAFLDVLYAAVAPGVERGFTGQVRKNTWDALQPKITLRYKPNDDITLYGGFSRGFRSGGFNQTGVGAVARTNGFLGVNDLFEEETANTFEMGIKGEFFEGRVNAAISGYHTQADGTYFFIFEPTTSTQNLGNIDEVDYTGFEFEASALVTEGLSMNFGVGFTDSEIKKAADPRWIGNEAPQVSRYTLNLGAQYRRELPVMPGWEGFARVDFQQIGETWWEPRNFTSRRPVPLLDVRAGVESDHWVLTAWSRNLNNHEYNSEFSPGQFDAQSFVFKGAPRRWGVDLEYRF